MSTTILVALLGLSFLLAFVQALFFHLAAKLFDVESTYGTALKVALVLAVFNGGLSVLQSMLGAVPHEGMDPSLIFAQSCGGLLLNLAIGTGTVAFFYAIPYGRALLTYVTGCLSYVIGMAVLVAVLIFGTVYFLGEGAIESGLDRLGADLELPRSNETPPSTEAYDLLEDVEFTEFENAIDVEVSQADHYIGKKVRIIHGSRRESIGTLKEVTATSLVVSVKIEGGRVEIPIQKSKITTFQLIGN